MDSSVAAALLLDQGYAVTGVTMSFIKQGAAPLNCGTKNIEDAKEAAKILGIGHVTLDFAEQMDALVIEEFSREYLSGRTPNPCIQCNQNIKFGALLESVHKQGADFLATGHYANIVLNTDTNAYELRRGIDDKKDQSYFLYRMPKEILGRIIFPLGGLTKDEVREIAGRYRLNTADKEESQDICFVPETGYKEFIKERVGETAFQPGPFKDQEGMVIGEHKGVVNYTIGQRDKLELALGFPAYVYKIDREANAVYVGPKECLYAKGLLASRLNMISSLNSKEPLEVQARIRYNAPEVGCSLMILDDRHFKVDFKEPQRSITPGQSVVLYQGNVILGGGIIDQPLQTFEENSGQKL